MAQRVEKVTTYEVDRVIEPTYKGGDVALSEDGRILATCLGEDVLLTDMNTGQRLANITGVSPGLPIVEHRLTRIPG